MPSDPLDPDAPRAATPSETALSRRVDLTTLRLFIAICEEQNLTRAANREGIAASAVSKRMGDCELAFGVTLFRRLSKGMALTPAGEALLHHARVTLLNVEKIAVEVIGEGMDMRAIPLRDEWARRQLKIAVRDSHQLLGRLMFGHLQAAEGREAA